MQSQCNAKTTNKNMNCYDSGVRQIGMNQLNEITGNFGQSPSSANINFRCGSNCYEQAMRQEYSKGAYTADAAQKSRQLQAVQHAVQSSQMRKKSGMY
jgi:hypothetical protein